MKITLDIFHVSEISELYLRATIVFFLGVYSFAFICKINFIEV